MLLSSNSYVYALYIFQKSFSRSVLGLAIALLDMSFHLLIFCTTLFAAMRSTWPNQFNLCFFNKPNYILSFIYVYIHTYIHTHTHTHTHTHIHIQDVPGGIVNILGGGSMDYSEQISSYKHVSNFRWVWRYSCLNVTHKKPHKMYEGKKNDILTAFIGCVNDLNKL